jgi:hypothetical protein
MARTVTNNHLTTYDKLSISPLMRLRKKVTGSRCDIMIDPSNVKDTYAFLKENINSVAECFIGNKIRFYDYGEQSLYLAQYKTDVTVLPIYFTVDFKEDFVTLTLLED